MEGDRAVSAMHESASSRRSACCRHAAGRRCWVLIGVGRAASPGVYVIEDGFEHLPIHWMWWPAIGGFAVGVVGWIVPDTLGVGYYNIRAILSQPQQLTVGAIAFLCTMKFVSWSISLGSGTSGGTLTRVMHDRRRSGSDGFGTLNWLVPKRASMLGLPAWLGHGRNVRGTSRAIARIGRICL